MTIRPPLQAALPIPVALGTVGAIVDYWALSSLRVSSVDLRFFALAVAAVLGLVLLVAALYWAARLLSLRYVIGDHHLSITCLDTKFVIPLARIEAVAFGEDIGGADALASRRRMLRPPGITTLPGLGRVACWVTSPDPTHLTVVLTDDLAYALSISNPRHLVRLWDQRRGKSLRAGGEERIDWQLARFGRLWTDPALRWIGIAAALANAAIFAYLFYRYPMLPSFLPVQHTPLGDVERIGLRSELFQLPIVAAAIFVGNLLLAPLLRDRLLAVLVTSAALIVQILVMVVVFNLATVGA
ncbi:MAG: hypothetical protein HYX89_05870 [Chloroflexi bacterium]|nr:hypothetical protein [Chloroflexota bacterium]